MALGAALAAPALLAKPSPAPAAAFGLRSDALLGEEAVRAVGDDAAPVGDVVMGAGFVFAAVADSGLGFKPRRSASLSR
ncbi:hypothetical protein EON66_04560, partial [archaeon]